MKRDHKIIEQSKNQHISEGSYLFEMQIKAFYSMELNWRLNHFVH